MRMMRRIQLPSVALVAGVHVASPMVHTPPLIIEHPRLPVARVDWGSSQKRYVISRRTHLNAGEQLPMLTKM